MAIRYGSAKQRNGITLDVPSSRYVPTMSETALDMAHQLDRRVTRCAAALRYLAYALFVGTLTMALSNQLSYGNEIFSGGDSRVPLEFRISQFVSIAIPYLTLAAVVLAISVFTEIAMDRVRVAREATFNAQNTNGPAQRMSADDNLWRKPSVSGEGG